MANKLTCSGFSNSIARTFSSVILSSYKDRHWSMLSAVNGLAELSKCNCKSVCFKVSWMPLLGAAISWPPFWILLSGVLKKGSVPHCLLYYACSELKYLMVSYLFTNKPLPGILSNICYDRNYYLSKLLYESVQNRHTLVYQHS